MTEIATQEVARARAAQIRAGIQNYLHTLANVAAAYQQRDWKALGYESWDAYVDGEYGADRLKLSPEHRQKAVAELRLAGMSMRAIGSAVGVDEKTVRNDLRGAEFSAPDEIQGADGKTYASTRPTAAGVQSGAPADGSDASGAALESHPVATGERPAVETADPARPGPVEGSPGPGRVTPDDSTGNDLGPVDAQESAWAPSAAPGSAGQTSEPGVPDPLDDREALAEQHRERSSAAVAEALVAIRMRLEPDPIRWLRETWKPGGYRLREMPRVRDCFTPDGLRTSAAYLIALAEHLEQNGETL